VHPDVVLEDGAPASQVTPRGRIEMVDGDASIRQSLLLLSTSPGERVMRPDYGCRPPRVRPERRHDGRSRHPLRPPRRQRWEPGSRSSPSMPAATDHPERLVIELDYRVRATRRADTIVYPPTSPGGRLMPLRSPNLDDRPARSGRQRDARIHQEAPEWSTCRRRPGIVLLEVFAYLTDRSCTAQPGPGQAVHRVPAAHRRPSPAARRGQRRLVFTGARHDRGGQIPAGLTSRSPGPAAANRPSSRRPSPAPSPAARRRHRPRPQAERIEASRWSGRGVRAGRPLHDRRSSPRPVTGSTIVASKSTRPSSRTTTRPSSTAATYRVWREPTFHLPRRRPIRLPRRPDGGSSCSRRRASNDDDAVLADEREVVLADAEALAATPRAGATSSSRIDAAAGSGTSRRER
jgi:hypothetical protein